MKEPIIYFYESVLNKQKIIVLQFAFSKDIFKYLKYSGLVHWSDELRKWYVFPERDQLNALYQNLKAQGFEMDIQQVLVSKANKKFISTENVSVCEDYKNYLLELRMSDSTIATYSNFIISYARFLGNDLVSNSNPSQLRNFINYSVKRLGYSISTHRQMISAFKHLAVLHPQLGIIIETMTRPKRDAFKPQILSVQEVIKLLQVTQNLKHRFALAMLYSCGLRVGELLSMKISHIDMPRQQVFIKNGKGRKDRYVSIAISTLPLINNYINTYRPTTYVLESSTGGLYSSSSVRAFLKKSCLKAGITKKITPHCLRHSYATHMIESGVGLRHVQELLGHSKPETTMLYTHIARKDLLQIVNPLDLAVQMYKTDKNNTNMRLSG